MIHEMVFDLIPNTKMSYIKHEKEFLSYVKKKNWKRARGNDFFYSDFGVTGCKKKDSLQCAISCLNLRPKFE